MRKTALSTPLSALVSTCGPRNDWSPSTPIPHTASSFAADSAPSPHPPATWNTTFEPAAIWFSASSLHFAWSSQSCEYVQRDLHARDGGLRARPCTRR